MKENRDVSGTLSRSDLHRAWIANYRSQDVDGFAAEIIYEAIRAAKIKLGSQVLDAGCGTGVNTARLASSGFDVTGIDLSQFVIDRTRDRMIEEGLRVTLKKGDLTNLEFDDSSFDAVFCIGVLMHIPAFTTALDELIRILKPGGKLIISETNENSLEMLAYRSYWKAVSTRGLEIERHPYGTEAWSNTSAGPLVARKMNIPWLLIHMRQRGMMIRYKRAGVFTEAFRVFNYTLLKKVIVGLNRAWFRLHGPAGLSTGVTLIFEKS